MVFRFFLAAAALIIFMAVSAAQPVTVIGPVTVGHCAAFNSPTVIRDGGVCSSSSLIGTDNLWTGTNTFALPITANGATFTATTTFQTGADRSVIIGPWGSDTAYNAVSTNGSLASGMMNGIFGGKTGDDISYIVSTSDQCFRPTGVTTSCTVRFTSSALTMSATTEATNVSTGSFQTAGGGVVAKRFWIPGIATSAGLQTAVLCQSSAGEMIADSSACLASAARFKDIRGPMPDGALAKIASLPIDLWSYKSEGNFASDDWMRERIGPLADDVAKMDPRLAGYDKDGNIRTYSTDQLLAFTIKALQELKADNDNLRVCQQSWRCRIFGSKIGPEK